MGRVVNSFLALITGMVADGIQMEIRFSSWTDLDSVSKDTILLLKNKLKGELVITESVSYAHLDVYKRQLLNFIRSTRYRMHRLSFRVCFLSFWY